MPYIQASPDIRLYYEEHGLGTPLLFLHGFTLDHRMWGPQAEPFSNRYRVIIPDARGHGLSDAPESGYSRGHRVEDLRGFVDTMQINRFHLVGLSMGGSTAIGFALKYQERVLSLTLVSTGAAGYGAGKKISHIDNIAKKKGIEAARNKWKQITLRWYRQDQQDLRLLIETMMNEYSGAVWKDPMRGRYPRVNDLEAVHRITLPTLILAGEQDSMFLPLAEALATKIPDSRLRVFEKTGHMLNLEEPERFNREVREFIEGVERGL